jgi:hypothetical protein
MPVHLGYRMGHDQWTNLARLTHLVQFTSQHPGPLGLEA